MRALSTPSLAAALLALGATTAAGGGDAGDAGAPMPPGVGAETPPRTSSAPDASDPLPPAAARAASEQTPPPGTVAPAPSAPRPARPPRSPVLLPCHDDSDCGWLVTCVAGACRWGPERGCDDDGCRKEGECTLVDGACEAVRPEDCLQASICREDGRCTVAGHECVAASDAHCLRSEICASKGYCYADHEAGVCREYESTDPVPWAYHVESRIRWGLVAAGSGTFAGMYIVLLGAASRALPPEVAVPVVGPLLVIDEVDRTKLLWESVVGLLVVDSLGQTAGLTLLAFGLAAQKDVLVADPPGPSFAVAPLPGGLAFHGSF